MGGGGWLSTDDTAMHQAKNTQQKGEIAGQNNRTHLWESAAEMNTHSLTTEYN